MINCYRKIEILKTKFCDSLSAQHFPSLFLHFPSHIEKEILKLINNAKYTQNMKQNKKEKKNSFECEEIRFPS